MEKTYCYSQHLFENLVGAALPRFAELAPKIHRVQMARGEQVFAQDSVHPFGYVVLSGLVKLVYLGEDGSEWIKSFCVQGEFFASLTALDREGKTSFAVVAVEECVLERIAYADLEALALYELTWERMLRRAFQIFSAKKEKRERELLTLTPEQRYAVFAQDEPSLLQRIPQKDLARYLGITAVGLNRIVKRHNA
ncbi:MAG: Crp/Fnr family transcriptional regulator [Undibacterium sp.]|nr:Crp/Fnr family transcriptional regulator [Undibacterium sp.]